LLACDFDFNLPAELIAQQPMEPRDQSRLLVIYRQQQRWEHHIFSELPHLLRPGDVIVRNNSAVIPARLIGYRALTRGKWDGLFLREASDQNWEVLATTRGRPFPGEHIIVGQGLHLVLESKSASGSWIVRPDRGGSDHSTTLAMLRQHGQTPIPPYIRRGRSWPSDQLN
jgi:S-adenosylmethionine:tRNA ribosyltransferase-isomerase